MTTITYTITGMHCTSCAANIDLTLEDIEGVQAVDTAYGSSKTTITFDETLVSQNQIIATITTLGYQAKILE